MDERSRPARDVGGVFAAFDAVLSVFLLYDWLRPGVDHGPARDVWVAETALLSVALLAYGIWTRYRALAVAGQMLLLASIVGSVLWVWPQPWPVGVGREMGLTLVPLAALLTTIYAGRRAVTGAPLTVLLAVYEAVATLFFLGWVGRCVPAEMRFTVLSVVGAAVSGWAQVRHEPRWLWWSGGLTVVGVFTLFLLPGVDRAAFLHLVGVVVIAGQQQFARFWAKRDPAAAPTAPPQWQAALMIAATLCAWTFLNARMALAFDRAFTLAASWSLFAALVFATGLTLREKVYRWLGLAILVCTLGRIAVVDIWQLDSLGRAVSALCLGLVLLGIGYLYNRFHAKWHGLF